MAITRWNPTSELMSAWNDFDRLFNRLTRNVETDDESMTNVGTWRPAIDIDEREKEYVVSAEIPGIDKDDINISIKDNVLTISGEKPSPENDESQAHCTERNFGDFQRSIRFNTKIEQDRISADYHNGVLTIRLPNSEEAVEKNIPISFTN